MTNEAINELKKYTLGKRNTEKVEISVLQINRVIKALEQEPCGDCVSRKAVIDTLDNMDKALDDNRTVEEYKALLKECYEVLSPVNPQEKTGHWKLQPSNKEQGERDFIWWKCSKCGQVIFSETEKDRREYHAFCGRCGARMVEPQERSDKE